MANDVIKKLKLKEGDTIAVLNMPDDYKKSLGALPKGAIVLAKPGVATQLHWFVQSSQQLAKDLSKVMKLMGPGTTLWVFYPKGSSGIQTDLTRDKGWEPLVNNENFRWFSMISFDDTWTTFALRLKTAADRKKEKTPEKKREIFDYIDPEKKTVRLPDDLAAALKKKKKSEEFFQSLSFTNRKEYVEWIVTAKREETRAERVKGTIERLEKGWKNPRNM
jgi:hypothetical protein